MATPPDSVPTLVESLRALTESRGRSAALIDRTGAVAFTQLWEQIGALAGWLTNAGVRKGDRVLITGGNSADIASAYFAVHAAGAVTVLAGPDLSPDGVGEIVRLAQPKAILSNAPVSGCSQPRLAPAEYRQLLGRNPAEFLPACRAEDAADLMFTTGTTGSKKGVLLTHAAIASAATNINSFIGTRSSDVELVPIPLSHSFGLGRLRCFAQIGHTLALEPGMRNPMRVLTRLEEVHATGLAMVPAGFALLRKLTKDRLGAAGSRLRYIEIGSAPLGAEEREWLMRLLPRTRICHHYGLTEASRSAFTELHRDSAKAGTIGTPSPNVQIRVLTADGQVVGPGEPGELWVHGGHLMREYWQLPELTERRLRDGWLNTGDTGHVDADGYLFLMGRTDDLINVGGLKVAPGEVEERLLEHPAVRDAACVGVPDPNGVLGQVVKAYLVTPGGVAETDLMEWLRSRLAEHQVPRAFAFVEGLPRTASGKLQRHMLRDRLPGAS